MPAGPASDPLDGISQRRRRRHASYISTRRHAYDMATIVLLLSVPFLGMVLFGGVRVWSIGLLMAIGYAAVAMFFLRPLFASDIQRIQIPPGGVLCLLFFVYALLQIPFAKIPYMARFEWLKMGSAIGIYWAWSELASRHKRWRVILAVAFLVISTVAWYALIQHARGANMVLNLERPESYGARASGTYMCPNHFANMLEIFLCISLATLLIPGAGAILRLLAGYTCLLILPPLFLTQSRSGWIGAAAGVFVTCLMIAWRKNRRLFLIAIVLLPLILAAGGYGLWSFSPVVQERLRGATLSDPDSSVRARFLMWSDTMPMIKDAPLWGHGGGAYRWIYAHYKSHTLQRWFRYAHNEYLHLVAEYGFVGFALVAIIFAWIFFRFLRCFLRAGRDRDAYLIAGFFGAYSASMVHACFDFNLHVFANAQALVLIAGLVSGSLYAGGQIDAKPLSLKALRLICGTAVLVALFLGLSSARASASALLDRLAERQRKVLNTDGAIRTFQWSIRVDRGNWEPYVGLANIHKSRAFWSPDPAVKEEEARKALEYLDLAHERNPYDPEILYGKSKVLGSIGEHEKSLKLLKEIVEFAPNEMFFLNQYGLKLRLMGRYEEALEIFRRAAALGVPDEMIGINLRLLKKKLNEQTSSDL